MKLFKIENKVKLKILIWHMVSEMVKNWIRAIFYLHAIIPAQSTLQ